MREEVVSAYLAYLLSPKMDHGLGPSVLAGMLEQLGRYYDLAPLSEAARQLTYRLRDDLFADAASTVGVELELAYPSGTSLGFIDVVVRCGDWFIAIENKILMSSATPDQLRQQYEGLRAVLAQRGLGERRVAMVYLVPAVRDSAGWSLAQSTVEELNFPRGDGDVATLMTWQPARDHEPSVVRLLQTLLEREGRGEIAPLSYDTRQSLLAFIDFARNEFQGYPYDRAVSTVNTSQRRVSDLLRATEQLFVGVQYGMAGVLKRAWRKPTFANAFLPVSETTRGWQYLALHDFQQLTRWAMDPDNQPLTGIKWAGKPFFTSQLSLVARAAGDTIFIGARGGLEAVRQMTPEELRQRRTWEISSTRRSGQWFSGTEFCAVLDSKGVSFDQIDAADEETSAADEQ